jgi:nicotinate-nucleotide adenylyltransferase
VIKNLKTSFKNNIPSCFSYFRKRKIGILGGSFNPAHSGHIHISSTAKLKLGLDEIWWLVAPQNRLKSHIGMETFQKRLSYARSLTDKFNYIKVLDLEEKNNLYASYKTVKFLSSKSKTVKFIWLMGSDILDNFNKWLYPSLITKKMPIAVVARPGYCSSLINTNYSLSLGKRIKPSKSKIIFLKKKPIWIFIKQRLLAISSSEIRLSQHLNNMDAKK